MSDFSMTELHDMASAYVLGALNPDEHAAFERALETSQALAQDVHSFRAVVTQIGNAQELAPPPALRARFLARIASKGSASDAGTPPGVRASGTATSESGASDSASTNADATVAAPLDASKRPFSVSTGGAPAAQGSSEKGPRQRGWLTGIIAVGLAASLVFAVQRNSQVTALTAQLGQRDSILAARMVQLAQRDSTLNTMLEAGRNLVLVNLGAVPDNGPAMQLFWNVKTGRGVVHAVGLKPADAGKTYQLWMIKDGKAVPLRIFNTGADNQSLQWGIELPTATTGVTAVAISVEPAGGSPQPTTTPFLVGELPKAMQ